MRARANWRIGAILSAVLLLSSSDLCMLAVCTPHAPHEFARAIARSSRHDAVAPRSGPHDHGSERAAGHDHGTGRDSNHDHGRKPCQTVVTLAVGPELTPPQAQVQPAPHAVLAGSPPAIEAALESPAGPAPPGREPGPPRLQHLGASGVRAPPIA